MADSPLVSHQELLELLPSIDRGNDSTWLATLEHRKQEESTFHNDKVERHGHARDSEDRPDMQRSNKQFYTTTSKSTEYIHQWIDTNTAGKVVLDYACGQGELTVRAAKAGAKLAIGIDISLTSIENARDDAATEGLSENTAFIQADCEDTRLPDNSVDVIICSGMLHHLDVEHAFPEMFRVLKPGGVCLAIEALNYNPIIRRYRMRTPELRTEWEKHHILSHREVAMAEKQFDVKNRRYWHLFSVMATPFRKTPFFRAAVGLGNLLDSVLLRIPPISLMAWQFSFELHKPLEAAATAKTSPEVSQPAPAHAQAA